jgi:hypothetical protein
MPRLSALLLSLCVSFAALAATPEEDVQNYIRIFQTGADADRAADDLGWKGISDTRLYDVIAERLRADAQATSREGRNHAARLIKALGFSGQPKYAETLNSVAADYRRPVEGAMRNLRLYEQWNPVIANRASWDPKYSDDVNRVRNMLTSKDIQLQGVGAKRVFYAHPNEQALLDLLAERLRDCYKTVSDPDSVDACGWMINGLGKSNAQQYRAVIQEVASGAGSDKLRSRAEKTLRR